MQIESQSKQIEYQSKQMKIMNQKISECTGDLRLLITAFKDMYANPHLTRQDTSGTQVYHVNLSLILCKTCKRSNIVYDL